MTFWLLVVIAAIGAGAAATLGVLLKREAVKGWRWFLIQLEFREMERQLSGHPVHGRTRAERFTDW